MNMSENNITLTAAFKMACAAGARRVFEDYRAALLSDKTAKGAVMTITQGPDRRIYLVPKDVAEDFAKRYAAAHPRPARAPAVNPNQLPLELPMQCERDPEIALMRAELTQFNLRLSSMESTLDRLVKMWEDRP